MALNKEQKNIAYLAGRLVAVLRAAELANNGEKARLTTEEKVDEVQNAPNTIIGSFLSLRHIRDGVTAELDEVIHEIMEKVPEEGFPKKRFTQEEWTTFWFGYWQQRGEHFRMRNGTFVLDGSFRGWSDTHLLKPICCNK